LGPHSVILTNSNHTSTIWLLVKLSSGFQCEGDQHDVCAMISKINALRTRATLTKRVHLNEVNPRFLAEYRQVLPQCFLVIAASFAPEARATTYSWKRCRAGQAR